MIKNCNNLHKFELKIVIDIICLVSYSVYNIVVSICDQEHYHETVFSDLH